MAFVAFDAPSPVRALDRVALGAPSRQTIQSRGPRSAAIAPPAGVAELADAPALGPGGQPWGFESLRPHSSARWHEPPAR